MDQIIPRQRIAQQADEAARAWAADPSAPKPANPFDPEWSPEHHAAWRASFERAVTLYLTGEVSA